MQEGGEGRRRGLEAAHTVGNSAASQPGWGHCGRPGQVASIGCESTGSSPEVRGTS